MPSNAKKSKKPALKLSKPVVLVGLMGAGKTTIGKRLATLLDLSFVDSDNEIVEAAGCSISDIFEIYGEQLFRDLEQRVMLRLLTGDPIVLATGGGAFINPAIRDAVAKHGLSVWLKAELDVLVERVSRRNTRPLLKSGDKREILERLMNDRYPVYAKADIVVDSNLGSHEAVVHSLARALEEWQKNHD
jgi:shikimate kinase